MRKYIIALILSIIPLGCGNSGKNIRTSEPAKAPWETLTDTTERSYYTKTIGCPAATEMMNTALEWELTILDDGGENPIKVVDSATRWIEMRGPGPAGETAIMQYKKTNTGQRITEIAVLSLAGLQFTVLDYFIIRDIKSGLFDDSTDYDTLTKSATGIYFCLWM